MEQTYRRGDVFSADLGAGIGSEQQGVRPVIVIQNDVGNQHSPTVIVAPMTTQGRKKHELPTHCFFDTVEGLNEPSMAILEQIRTIDKKRLSKKLGRLTDSQMEEINQGLLVSLGYTRAKPKALEVCLCHRCMGYFYDTSKYIVRRKNPYQEIKGDCTYCNYGKGYDYLITLKARR